MENNVFNFGGDSFDTPATERQLNALKNMGYDGNLTGLTKDEASNIIEQLKAQKEAATPKAQPKQPEPQPQQAPKYEVAEKNISDLVIKQVKNLEENQNLVLPAGYNPTNALKSAYLKLSESNLLNTDKTALAEALLNMCIQGLNPAKNQCYFINYGGKVNMMRSYFGDRTVAINTGLIKDVQANVIYAGDEVNVEYVNDYMVVHHTTSWGNMSNEIVGAYAFAVLNDGTKRYDIMTMERIKKSWSMSKNNTNNKLQTQYTDDACKRTVIRHLVKNLFNETSDAAVVVESYNKTTEQEYVNEDYKANSIGDVKVEQEQSGTKEVEVDFND